MKLRTFQTFSQSGIRVSACVSMTWVWILFISPSKSSKAWKLETVITMATIHRLEPGKTLAHKPGCLAGSSCFSWILNWKKENPTKVAVCLCRRIHLGNTLNTFTSSHLFTYLFLLKGQSKSYFSQKNSYKWLHVLKCQFYYRIIKKKKKEHKKN